MVLSNGKNDNKCSLSFEIDNNYALVKNMQATPRNAIVKELMVHLRIPLGKVSENNSRIEEFVKYHDLKLIEEDNLSYINFYAPTKLNIQKSIKQAEKKLSAYKEAFIEFTTSQKELNDYLIYDENKYTKEENTKLFDRAEKANKLYFQQLKSYKKEKQLKSNKEVELFNLEYDCINKFYLAFHNVI